LRARLPSGATPTESLDAGKLIRLQRKLTTVKEQMSTARRELSANTATETEYLTERHVQRDSSTDIKMKIDIEREAASRFSANRQLQKAKQKQADMKILLESTQDSLQRARKDL